MPRRTGRSSRAGRRIEVQSSPRQHRILNLIVTGHTNREIAGKLGIGNRTVDVHRLRLMQRLHVRNVAYLFWTAIRLGLGPRLKGLRVPRVRRPALQA